MLTLLTIATYTKNYDYQEINQAIVETVFKKSVYENLSLDQCFQLLSRGHTLELKQAALEKLELYILERLHSNDDERSRFNQNRIQFYLESYARRRRLSLV